MYREKVKAQKGSSPYEEAIRIVRVASKYTSEVYIEKGNKCANAKSVLGIVALMLEEGDIVTVSAQGADAGIALKTVCQTIGEALHLRNEYSVKR